MHFDRGCSPLLLLLRRCFLGFMLFVLPDVCLCGCRTEVSDQEVRDRKVVVRQKIFFHEEIPSAKEVEATSRDQEIKVQETSALEDESLKSGLPSPQENAPAMVKEEGCYKTRKGESLFIIAAHSDVYGDSLKWPSLFRLNADKLMGVKAEEGFQHQMLPEGLELRFVTEQKAIENSSRIENTRWVVSVISAQDQNKIVMPVITLINDGYYAYLATAEVKGKEWIRLRVGFFSDRSDADSEKKKIMSVLHVNNAWVDKIDEKELVQFARY